jgi:hypothetical protein
MFTENKQFLSSSSTTTTSSTTTIDGTNDNEESESSNEVIYYHLTTLSELEYYLQQLQYFLTIVEVLFLPLEIYQQELQELQETGKIPTTSFHIVENHQIEYRFPHLFVSCPQELATKKRMKIVKKTNNQTISLHEIFNFSHVNFEVIKKFQRFLQSQYQLESLHSIRSASSSLRSNSHLSQSLMTIHINIIDHQNLIHVKEYVNKIIMEFTEKRFLKLLLVETKINDLLQTDQSSELHDHFSSLLSCFQQIISRCNQTNTSHNHTHHSHPLQQQQEMQHIKEKIEIFVLLKEKKN